jgi:metal-responsive CopG/Arc/MetJ family transcriptional regulator
MKKMRVMAQVEKDIDEAIKEMYTERDRAIRNSLSAYNTDPTTEARENGISMGLELAINILTSRKFNSLDFPRE